jgi:hypothetical protein
MPAAWAASSAPAMQAVTLSQISSGSCSVQLHAHRRACRHETRVVSSDVPRQHRGAAMNADGCVPCARGVLWEVLLVAGHYSTVGIVDDETSGLRALINGSDAFDGHLAAAGESVTMLSGVTPRRKGFRTKHFCIPRDGHSQISCIGAKGLTEFRSVSVRGCFLAGQTQLAGKGCVSTKDVLLTQYRRLL